MNPNTLISEKSGKSLSNLPISFNLIEEDEHKMKHPGYIHILNYLHPVDNKSVLDCGHDSGNFSLLLYLLNAKVTSIDVQENTIKVLERDPREKIFKYNISPENLDFLPEDTYDSVVFKYVFSAFSDKIGINKNINSVYRALKSGGSFIIMDYIIKNSRDKWSKSIFVDFLSASGFRIMAIQVPEIPSGGDRSLHPYYIIYALK